MSLEQANRIADIVLCDVRDHKTLARVWALFDGRAVISAGELRAALTGPPREQEEKT
jgi:hypothetical protein